MIKYATLFSFVALALFGQEPVVPFEESESEILQVASEEISSEEEALKLEQPLAALPSENLTAQSADVQHDEKRDTDAYDMDALRRWIQDKRLVTVKEIGGDFSISGDVRSEFQIVGEEKNGVQQRGDHGLGLKPMYAWDVEVDLMFDYRTDRSWIAVKLEFDNDMGTRSGTVNRIKLEKAYLGGRIIAGDTFMWDTEIGRRYLFNTFESKLQFSSIFDGALMRFSKAFYEIGDFYWNVGSFLVNDSSNHYGFVTEIGALRISNTGLNLKYSLIDWYRPGSESSPSQTSIENQLANLRFRYLVSQLLAIYQMYPEWIGKRLVRFYAAGLTNHIALANPLATVGVEGQPFGKQNWGWYAGVAIGLVKKKGDFAIDMNYQWLQTQAVPSFDVSGIGRGNAAGSGLYTVNDNGSGGPTTKATAAGNTNYKGFEVELLYAFTDNLTFQQSYKMSFTLDKNIGPYIKYNQYEAEFIYAF